MSLAADIGLGKSEMDEVVGTPVHISMDCLKERKNDGGIRTALALLCNRCLAPCAERIYATFNLLLTEAIVEEPTQQNLGVVFGDNPHIQSVEVDDEAQDDEAKRELNNDFIEIQ